METNTTANIISIHAPSRERRINRLNSVSTIRFQSTLPRGSDPITAYQLRQCKPFQSTLPRGSDTSKDTKHMSLTISIHAPSRERPFQQAARFCLAFQFQSTLPRGSDRMAARQSRLANGFQSTLPRGSDYYVMLSDIFTYAFQSTLPRGSDGEAIVMGKGSRFQSTLPRGSDRKF